MNRAKSNIFLVGMPRSGTTWIGKIFDSHPDTLYVHEPDSFMLLDKLPLFAQGVADSEQEEVLSRYIRSLPSINNYRVTAKRPVFQKAYQSKFRSSLYKGSIYLAALARRAPFLPKLDPALRVKGSDLGKVTTVWKSIESLGRLPMLARAFPDMPCVHIIRNPAGYIASVMRGEAKSSFRSSEPSSDDIGLFEMLRATDVGRDSGYDMHDLKAMEPVERLAIRWSLYNEIANSGCRDLKNYNLRRYEDLCREPIEQSKELFDICGLFWSPQTEGVVGESTAKNKNSYYSVFRDPLKAAYKWQSERSEQQIEKIKTILASSTAFSWYKNDF